jgi:hypothetical protein
MEHSLDEPIVVVYYDYFIRNPSILLQRSPPDHFEESGESENPFNLRRRFRHHGI